MQALLSGVKGTAQPCPPDAALHASSMRFNTATLLQQASRASSHITRPVQSPAMPARKGVSQADAIHMHYYGHLRQRAGGLSRQ